MSVFQGAYGIITGNEKCFHDHGIHEDFEEVGLLIFLGWVHTDLRLLRFFTHLLILIVIVIF